jgi:hypothetical protein
MLLARVSGQSCDALVGHVRGRWGRSCVLTLLVILVSLVPLAHASPLDPLWIAGIYDDTDFDEVVVAVGSAEARAEDSRVIVEKPTIFPLATLPVDAAVVRAVSRSTCSVRAPPA